MDRTFEPRHSLEMLQGERRQNVPIPQPSGEVYELVAEIESVVRAVRDGTPPVCTAGDGRWSVLMCLKASESLERGRVVLFEE
jgi:myo-inositol 2-dehydrogenase/D-chiro-inositol 1-dehydrogenase